MQKSFADEMVHKPAAEVRFQCSFLLVAIYVIPVVVFVFVSFVSGPAHILCFTVARG
jgi:hypothetical protein